MLAPRGFVFLARVRPACPVEASLDASRFVSGWTKVELGDRLHVSRQTIYAIESGLYDEMSRTMPPKRCAIRLGITQVT